MLEGVLDKYETYLDVTVGSGQVPDVDPLPAQFAAKLFLAVVHCVWEAIVERLILRDLSNAMERRVC